MSEEAVQLTRKDLTSDQEVRWCPGCGDYAILKGVQNALAGLGIPREQMVVVSGIGCAARFPYYMETYGFHSIHGRSPAVATGVKMANPDLHVWLVGGDGDMMSIGGNHLIHILRRNLDVTILLFNNRIYGLTKGQFSPTSGLGVLTKSSPMGSIDPAFDPIGLALGAGGTFVARTVDLWGKHLEATVAAAHAHKGTALIEILQNCIIFNDGTFDPAVGKKARDENSIELVHGEPLVFGTDRNKGIRLNGTRLEVVELGDGVSEDDLMRHDAHDDSAIVPHLMATMQYPDFPVPTGIFRQVDRPTYEQSMEEQVHMAQLRSEGKKPDLGALFNQGDTWVVS
ncbi:MAG: 2-oxoacid:ferredoxin oxidoreductase subunit beta [Deltaproteobacteria bacterium]|nr:2-oxoacid:ferredoxin oxidoreductase subunit beta [Deltaproteobacteria bacterium]